MLQHNNNNNYPCLDVAHRELLHGCRRNGTTFSSALGFGAIPLIKGLRAWAVSGGYSRSRRRAAAAFQAPEPPHEGRIGTGHRQTHNVISSFHTPGVRQGGLGALVTVATLKDSDGGRQTQTRCLFLKAEGCNYLCTVGTRVAGRRSGRGSQDGLGVCDGKPVRKWRKSSKRPKSTENISVVENKEVVVSTKLELLDKSAITQCLKAKHSHASTSSAMVNDDEDHLDRSESSTLNERCEPATYSSSTKYNISIEVQEDTTLGSDTKLNGCEFFVGQDMPIPINDSTDENTETSKHKSDLTADVNLNHILNSKEIGVPKSEERNPGSEVVIHNKNGTLSTISQSHYKNTDTIKYEIDVLADENLNKSNEFGAAKSKEHGLWSEVLSEDTNTPNGTLLNISHSCCEETSITPASRNPLNDTLLTNTEAEQEIKTQVREDFINHDTEKIIHFGETKKDIASAANQQRDHVSEAVEEHWGVAVCSQHEKKIKEVNTISEIVKDVNTKTEAFEEFANSLSRGFSSFNAANATTSLPNPAPTTNTTALRSLSRQEEEEEEEGTECERLALKPKLELLAKQERGQEGDKVADEGSEVVDEDEDEFGVFMEAGDEQVWNEGFNELQKVPCEKHDGIDFRNSSVSNEPPSWTSDWTGVLSIKQSDDTWTAFKQEVVSKGTEECWFSTAVENMHLTHSSLINVPSVFLEAFSCVESSCGDSDCTPTLKELLRGSAAKNRTLQNGTQSLLDGLQDLDRMIGVKYKGAESLSRKLLLQSLNLSAVNPERAGGRKQNMARFSPNLPTSNRQLAANAKRRLSYDINRNIMS